MIFPGDALLDAGDPCILNRFTVGLRDFQVRLSMKFFFDLPRSRRGVVFDCNRMELAAPQIVATCLSGVTPGCFRVSGVPLGRVQQRKTLCLGQTRSVLWFNAPELTF